MRVGGSARPADAQECRRGGVGRRREVSGFARGLRNTRDGVLTAQPSDTHWTRPRLDLGAGSRDTT